MENQEPKIELDPIQKKEQGLREASRRISLMLHKIKEDSGIPPEELKFTLEGIRDLINENLN